jgi:hypothetical protein
VLECGKLHVVRRLVVSAGRVEGDRHRITLGDAVLWYEFSEPPTTASAATAAVAALPYAMNTADALHIDGEVGPELLGNLEEYCDYWTMWRPDIFRRIPITAESVTASEAPSRAAVAAYSGGVDSTYQLVINATAAHGNRTVPIVAAILIGGFDIPVGDATGMARVAARARAIVDGFDIPVVTVRTNWREFNPHWEMTFGAGVTSVLHHFREHAGIGLIAADEPYTMEVRPWGSNSTTNHLLGGDNFRVRTDGLGVTRTEKCAVIGQYEVVRKHLRVCWAGPVPDENCGCCEKCVRTKLNFVAAGIGEIPALGPLTKRQVAGVRAKEVQRSYLREVATQLPPTLSLAVRAAILRNRLGNRF